MEKTEEQKLASKQRYLEQYNKFKELPTERLLDKVKKEQ